MWGAAVSLLYFLMSMTAGLLLDWAIYERVVSALGRIEINTGYRDFLYPRVIVTLVGAAMCFFAVRAEDGNDGLLVSGAVTFALSTCYGAYRYLRGDDLSA